MIAGLPSSDRTYPLVQVRQTAFPIVRVHWPWPQRPSGRTRRPSRSSRRGCRRSRTVRRSSAPRYRRPCRRTRTRRSRPDPESAPHQLTSYTRMASKSVLPASTNERNDFTPWLAKNAELLGRALGLDLEHEATEREVGKYSADLVFREQSEDKQVVVENMYGITNHDHLGKVITYAAGLGTPSCLTVGGGLRGRASLCSKLTEFHFFGRVSVLRSFHRCVADRRLPASTPVAGRRTT